ncbi:hypothetical protein JL2886_02417 [Phaeobacter gallaeciensis]|uniref:Uncharacterized protein n=1 Tax=Phaeobacter gallaeciensis TaxID=60890 RepID=A0A1B0ZT29_9RHOB|nr:hypothetical protein JL2886_02417 [Phaeobacter gallaeciensis]
MNSSISSFIAKMTLFFFSASFAEADTSFIDDGLKKRNRGAWRAPDQAV